MLSQQDEADQPQKMVVLGKMKQFTTGNALNGQDAQKVAIYVLWIPESDTKILGIAAPTVSFFNRTDYPFAIEMDLSPPYIAALHALGSTFDVKTNHAIGIQEEARVLEDAETSAILDGNAFSPIPFLNSVDIDTALTKMEGQAFLARISRLLPKMTTRNKSYAIAEFADHLTYSGVKMWDTALEEKEQEDVIEDVLFFGVVFEKYNNSLSLTATRSLEAKENKRGIVGGYMVLTEAVKARVGFTEDMTTRLVVSRLGLPPNLDEYKKIVLMPNEDLDDFRKKVKSFGKHGVTRLDAHVCIDSMQELVSFLFGCRCDELGCDCKVMSDLGSPCGECGHAHIPRTPGSPLVAASTREINVIVRGKTKKCQLSFDLALKLAVALRLPSPLTLTEMLTNVEKYPGNVLRGISQRLKTPQLLNVKVTCRMYLSKTHQMEASDYLRIVEFGRPLHAVSIVPAKRPLVGSEGEPSEKRARGN